MGKENTRFRLQTNCVSDNDKSRMLELIIVGEKAEELERITKDLFLKIIPREITLLTLPKDISSIKELDRTEFSDSSCN